MDAVASSNATAIDARSAVKRAHKAIEDAAEKYKAMKKAS
jgi:hypothetical protein